MLPVACAGFCLISPHITDVFCVDIRVEGNTLGEKKNPLGWNVSLHSQARAVSGVWGRGLYIWGWWLIPSDCMLLLCNDGEHEGACAPVWVKRENEKKREGARRIHKKEPQLIALSLFQIWITDVSFCCAVLTNTVIRSEIIADLCHCHSSHHGTKMCYLHSFKFYLGYENGFIALCTLLHALHLF